MVVLLSVGFCVFHTLTFWYWLWWLEMQTIRVINVLWMGYSTSERQFLHEGHVWDLCPIPIIAKTRPAKDVGKRKQLTRLNSMYTLFDQAQPAPKQMYDKQHGKAKGTISGQASARTTQHNMTDETCSVMLNHHDIVGENSGKLHGWQAQRPRLQPGIGTAFHDNVSYARVQHHTKWWFCLVSRFSVFHTLTFWYWLWWLEMQTIRVINVLWMRYSTLESQFHHEVHVGDPFVTQLEVFEMFVLCL